MPRLLLLAGSCLLGGQAALAAEGVFAPASIRPELDADTHFRLLLGGAEPFDADPEAGSFEAAALSVPADFEPDLFSTIPAEPLAVVADSVPIVLQSAEYVSAEDFLGRTSWGRLIGQSVWLLTFQTAFRMSEEKTRRELKGPFFRDWGNSIRNFQWKWDDRGKFFTNYLSHPWLGSIHANLWADNNLRDRLLMPGDRGYWGAKGRQFLYSGAMTLAFELGPISETSLGNIGLKDPSKQTVIDYVTTPVVGVFGWSVAEDYLDKLAFKVEKNHKYWGNLLRSLCITRALQNLVLSFRVPWYRHRDEYPLSRRAQ